jgi:RNA polymerase sigma-70 factor (ECF subfamily)
MPEAVEEFARLLAQARRGDQAAIQQLAQQYESKVRLVARVLLGPALRPYLDSVDLVQSVHRTLMLGLRQDKFDISSPEKLISLALALVRRKVARQWRHLQRQKRLTTGSADYSGDLPSLLASLGSSEIDPARAASLKDAVDHVCQNLDETERRLIELRLQGYSAAEIAGAVGLHPIAARVRMSRLRQRLRTAGLLDDWL